MEVVQRGEDSVKTYLADADSSSAVDLIHRCKVCVVGPSEWGKSSLVQSIEAMKPILVHPEDRTIGIELVSSYFAEAQGSEQGETFERTSGGVGLPESLHKRHQVTFWDVAGQDLYQVAHSLFYSRRTMYVLVVDLQAYDEQLNKVEALRTNAAEVEMDRFLSRYVFRWVRTIFARQADAEFLVLGTKADLLDNDPAKVSRVWRDLQSRIFQWKLNYVRELDQQSAEGKSTSSANIELLREKLARLASKEWLVVSVTSRESIKEVRLALQRAIEASERGFPMWKKYSQVLEAVHAKRNEATGRGDGQFRLEHSMMRVRPLCQYLMGTVNELTYDECCYILRTLHDLGDVLWYENEASGYLRDYVILDPMLVIDIVRGVISHELTKELRDVASNQDDNDGSDRVTPQTDGRVKHSLLETLPLWEHMDVEMVYAFKMLLQHFQLAYAAGNETMQPDSDLIVPSYWKVQLEAAFKSGDASTAQQSHASEVPPQQAYHCWEYELSADLADTVFEQFAVESSSSFITREVHGNCIQSSCAEFRSWTSLLRGESKNDVIRIEVAGESSELVWFNMRYYLMKLEKVLDAYLGLAIRKFVVVNGERHSLNAAVNSVRDKILLGGTQDELRKDMPWLPPDLEWMVNRSWRDISSFQQLQLVQLMRDKTDVVTKLVVAGDSQRRYPALWSLEYQVEQRVVLLRMLSDLSGKCFHEPIEIKVEPAFLARHGAKLQAGISLLANVVGSALSVPILETAIAGAASYVEGKTQQATKIHNLIERLDLSTTTGTAIATSTTAGLSPNGAIAVLRDLLLLYNDSMDELSITEASNLECAATSDGHYIWAHTHEIDLMKDRLTRCQPRFSDVLSTTTVSLPGSPTSSVLSSAASTTKKSGSAASSTLQLMLCVETVTGLPDWDWYKTYCTWQLCYGGSRMPLVTGATPTNPDSSFQPSWRSTKTTLEDVDSVELLQKCRLVVQLKRRSRIGWTKLIGVGEVSLGPLVSDDAKQNFHCDPIHVEVRAPGNASASAPRVVECQIAAVN